MSKITLGTAQFGNDSYGIVNRIGRLNYRTTINLLKYAWDNGINTFDTSPLYGNSEEIIGNFILSILKNEYNTPIIISKLPTINLKNMIFSELYNYIKSYICRTLKKLNIEKIPIYLLHHASDISYGDVLIDCLSRIKDEGLIERFGISAYYPREVEVSLDCKEMNVIQIPINILDHRLIKTGLLKELKRKGYIIFTRSIYLQGLLFFNPKNLPCSLRTIREPLLKLRIMAGKFGISVAELAFSFVMSLPEITSLVIGVEKEEQLMENIKMLKKKKIFSNDVMDGIISIFSKISEKLICPALWDV